MILVRCSLAASPFVKPLWAGFVVSLVVYCMSLTSDLHGGVVCVGVIFSMFPGMSFMISCIIEDLNLFGMPGFLLAGVMGRGGGVVSCLPASRCRWAGSRSCMGFVRSVFAANHAAACCFMWFSQMWSGGTPDSTCMASIGRMHVLYKIFMFWWLSPPFVLASIRRQPAAAAPRLVRCCTCCRNESLES